MWIMKKAMLVELLNALKVLEVTDLLCTPLNDS